MKTILFNHSDLDGGAAIAAYRTHQALCHVGVDSLMWVDKKVSDDWTVKAATSPSSRLYTKFRTAFGRKIPELFFQEQTDIYRSYNWLRSRWPGKLNNAAVDLVHVVWVNGESLSVGDIGRINSPKIMTLQDMWAFCGAEHYTESERYKEGYFKNGSSDSLSGFDIDRWVWNRKRQAWKQPFQLVAISEWLAECIRASKLFADWPVCVIPNPIDTTVWKPLDRDTARRAFNLPDDKKILLFGALGGTIDSRKGYAYLEKALSIIADVRDDIHLVVYGQSRPEYMPETPFPISFVGMLNDPVTMVLLNNAADVFVNPAIQEAFGQTASEAQACGLPVVAFTDTGIADIVDHKVTGYLAQNSNALELAEGVLWVLDIDHDSVKNSSHKMRANSRVRAVERFSYDVVGKQYQRLYASVLSGQLPRMVKP